MLSRAVTSYPLAVTAIVSILALLTVSLTLLNTIYSVSESLVIEDKELDVSLDYVVVNGRVYIVSSKESGFYEVIVCNDSIEVIDLEHIVYSNKSLYGPLVLLDNASRIVIVEKDSLRVVDTLYQISSSEWIVYESSSIEPPSLYIDLYNNRIEYINQYSETASGFYLEYRVLPRKNYSYTLQPSYKYVLDDNGEIGCVEPIEPINVMSYNKTIEYSIYSDDIRKAISYNIGCYGRYRIVYNVSLEKMHLVNTSTGYDKFRHIGYTRQNVVYRVIEQYVLYSNTSSYPGLYMVYYSLNHTIDYILVKNTKTGKLYKTRVYVEYNVELIGNGTVLNSTCSLVEINSSLTTDFPLYTRSLDGLLETVFNNSCDYTVVVKVEYEVIVPSDPGIYCINISTHINEPTTPTPLNIYYGGLVRLSSTSLYREYRLYNGSYIVVDVFGGREYSVYSIVVSMMNSSESYSVPCSSSLMLEAIGYGVVCVREYVVPDTILEYSNLTIVIDRVITDSDTLLYGFLRDSLWIYSGNNTVYIEYSLPPAIRVNGRWYTVSKSISVLWSNGLYTIVVDDMESYTVPTYSIQRMYCLRNLSYLEPVLVVDTPILVTIHIEYLNGTVTTYSVRQFISIPIENRLLRRIAVLVNSSKAYYSLSTDKVLVESSDSLWFAVSTDELNSIVLFNKLVLIAGSGGNKSYIVVSPNSLLLKNPK